MHNPTISGPMQMKIQESLQKLPGLFQILQAEGKAEAPFGSLSEAGEDAGFLPMLERELSGMAMAQRKSAGGEGRGEVVDALKSCPGGGTEKNPTSEMKGIAPGLSEEHHDGEPYLRSMDGDVEPKASMVAIPAETSSLAAAEGQIGRAPDRAAVLQILLAEDQEKWPAEWFYQLDSQKSLTIPDSASLTNHLNDQSHGPFMVVAAQSATLREAAPAPVVHDDPDRIQIFHEDLLSDDSLISVVGRTLRQRDFDERAIGEILEAVQERLEALWGTAVADFQVADRREEVKKAALPGEEAVIVDHHDGGGPAEEAVQTTRSAPAEASQEDQRISPDVRPKELLTAAKGTAILGQLKEAALDLPAEKGAPEVALSVPKTAVASTAAVEAQTNRVSRAADSGRTHPGFTEDNPAVTPKPGLNESLSATLRERGVNEKAIVEVVAAVEEHIAAASKTTAPGLQGDADGHTKAAPRSREAVAVDNKEGIKPAESVASHHGKETLPAVESHRDKPITPAWHHAEPLRGNRGTPTSQRPEETTLNSAAREGNQKVVIPDPKTAGTSIPEVATRGERLSTVDSAAGRSSEPGSGVRREKTAERATAEVGTRIDRISESVDAEAARLNELVSGVSGQKKPEVLTAKVATRGEGLSTVDSAVAGTDLGDQGAVGPKESSIPSLRDRGASGKQIADLSVAVRPYGNVIGQTGQALSPNEAGETGIAVPAGRATVIADHVKTDRLPGTAVQGGEAAEAVSRSMGRQAKATALNLSADEGQSKLVVPDAKSTATAAPRVSAAGMLRADMAKPDGRGEPPVFAEQGKIDLKEPLLAGRMDFTVTDAGVAAPKSGDGKPVDGYLLVDQVAGQLISEASKGAGRVKITLSPDHLGTLDMDIIIRENKVQVVFTADRNDVRQALQNHSEQLRNALIDQGLQISGMDFLVRGNLPGANGESAGGNLWWRENNQGAPRRGKSDKMSLPSSLSSLTQKKDLSAAGISLYV